MPPLTTKILQGDMTLTEGYYQLELPVVTGTALPNAFDNSALEEVYIKVLPGRGTEIYLPAISNFNRAWNIKIYITLLDAGDVRVLPVQLTETQNEVDYINGGRGVFFINNLSSTGYLHIVSYNNWMLLPALAPAPAFREKK